jgi:hypothetical protein
MAVFQAPPVPGCWRGGELIRIVDPLGLQVAWVSPALAGGIVGYYVRSSSSDGWTEVLACAAPGDGCPGWRSGSELLLRDERSQSMVPAWGSDATWSFESRDPTQTTVRGTIGDHVWTISLGCIDGELQIAIEPGNDDTAHCPPAGLRLHVGPAAGTLDRDDVRNGELRFRNGVLSSLAYTHSPGMACRASTPGSGECQVDFLSPRGGPAAPIAVTLRPVPVAPAG